jgi:alkanesulfonate monooxygenase SsuD/methylene tetrahydromethanopterin reductase-like flavin-dependent oxidoreductase (luciferase family)
LQQLGAPELSMLRNLLSCAAIGSPETVREQMAAFLERTGADELMVAGQIFDHSARLRSYEIALQAAQELTPATAA